MEPTIDWRDYIEAKPGVLCGKPVVKGKRISVEMILEHLAGGWTEEEMGEEYGLTPETVKAALLFAASVVGRPLTLELTGT